jgi:hypothetical protein
LLTTFSTARNTLESPLLRLPAEIRLHIYELVIPSSSYSINRVAGPLGNELIAFRPSPGFHGLLCASRQLNNETAGLPFKRSVFFPYTKARFLLLTSQLPKSTKLIRLRFANRFKPPWNSKLHFIEHLPQLEKLEILFDPWEDLENKSFLETELVAEPKRWKVLRRQEVEVMREWLLAETQGMVEVEARWVQDDVGKTWPID